MSKDQRCYTEVTSQPLSSRGWFYRRAILPVLALLRGGATPERLAWSLAAGAVIGINPLLGTTTVLCFAAAAVFRLNIAASQLANHAVYPLQLLLFIPLLGLGARIFRTQPLTLKPSAIFDMAKHHPLDLIRTLWQWEWHALVLWAAFTAIALPLIASGLTSVLRRLLNRMKRKPSLIVAAD